MKNGSKGVREEKSKVLRVLGVKEKGKKGSSGIRE
jgi:hypothetical protein